MTDINQIWWRPVEEAPKDGRMLRLQVRFKENSTEDDEVGATIGFNHLGNTGEDIWQFVGWCWSHDHFTEGNGEVIGWLPMFHQQEIKHG